MESATENTERKELKKVESFWMLQAETNAIRDSSSFCA